MKNEIPAILNSSEKEEYKGFVLNLRVYEHKENDCKYQKICIKPVNIDQKTRKIYNILVEENNITCFNSVAEAKHFIDKIIERN